MADDVHVAIPTKAFRAFVRKHAPRLPKGTYHISVYSINRGRVILRLRDTKLEEPILL